MGILGFQFETGNTRELIEARKSGNSLRIAYAIARLRAVEARQPMRIRNGSGEFVIPAVPLAKWKAELAKARRGVTRIIGGDNQYLSPKQELKREIARMEDDINDIIPSMPSLRADALFGEKRMEAIILGKVDPLSNNKGYLNTLVELGAVPRDFVTGQNEFAK